MRLSQRIKRQKKPKHNNSRVIIGMFALLIAMGIYSWDFQKSWKERQELSRYYLDSTASYSTSIKRSLQQEPSSSSTAYSDVSTTRTTSAPTMRPTSVKVQPEAKLPFASGGKQDGTLPPLNLIPNDQLREHDYFSDSWIITKDKFLNLERRRLGIVEDACFVAIGTGGAVYPSSKMFVDWTDFMVEHMSKWWNELRILQDRDAAMFQLTLQYFDQYIAQVFDNNPSPPSTFHETIAVVAFAPYKSGIADRGHELTFHSLAATLVSLYQVGFGRVVIAGYGDPDQHHVEAALDFLLAKASASKSVIDAGTYSKSQIKIGNTEFGFSKVTEQDWISTQWVKFNMPRGAVIGLQEALLGNINDTTNDTVTSRSAWLGTTHDASYWKYVYLTEPDTILHTKLELLPSIKKGLDDGLSFFPHRLQPIPHGSDLPSGRNMTTEVSSAHSGRFVPTHFLPFSNVTILDPTSTKRTIDVDPEGSVDVTAYHCCDAGPSAEHENCGTWWWTCGFHDGFAQAQLTQEEALEKHKRLAIYPMMRLKQGTGVVFGPTEHARRCLPSKNPCAKAEGN